MQMWSSSISTLRTVRGSCSCRADFFSTPSTTTDDPRTPTCVCMSESSPPTGSSGDKSSQRRFLFSRLRAHSRPGTAGHHISMVRQSVETAARLTWPSGEKTVRAVRDQHRTDIGWTDTANRAGDSSEAAHLRPFPTSDLPRSYDLDMVPKVLSRYTLSTYRYSPSCLWTNL